MKTFHGNSISYLNSKISKTLFTIKQVKHFLPYDSLKKLYSTLVESHLSYGEMPANPQNIKLYFYKNVPYGQ